MTIAFPGLTHVALTVSDPSVSVAWYTRLIGADPILGWWVPVWS
jgi:glyoxylase I family protein